MRPIPTGLAAHLASPATTLCRCWRLTRRDGIALGFTDHDRDLAFEGTAFRARTGLEAAEAARELGFAPGGGEVAGALSSAGIAEADVAAGLYDGAAVETWLVNWREPGERLLLDRSAIGEIRCADGAFVAELRGPMQRLDEERGRLFRAACSADLGDARCGVDLSSPARRTAGAALAASAEAVLRASGLGGFPDGVFSGGRLAWTSGANAGLLAEIRAQAGDLLHLRARPLRPVAAGDAFEATVGCDKRLATCAARFANARNFRGFPHMPGPEAVLRVARAGG